ncbi:unnamed protein product [Eruca vesicaria subsp. sativa]|uniref:Uncharacterized protein n=1 Tax=Eruca vesicaria subsp. sativa TaxID=29727 RepID=A0ABC8LPL6_ERUVS|nr:unnamed protein product [Eruca vesicaria subsp. sativa]
MTPSVPSNYVSILHLRERWTKEKDQNRKEDEEARRRNQHAEEQQTKEDDLTDLDEIRSNQSDQKHWGSKKDESIDGGEAKLETAAIGSEGGEVEGLPEKKRGRRKRYDSKKKKKRANQEVEECGSIKPREMHVSVKDQIRVYKKKEEKAMGKKSVVTAIETQFKELSIKRGQETKKLTARDLPLGRVRMPIETATMVWVKKERAGDGNGSGVMMNNDVTSLMLFRV